MAIDPKVTERIVLHCGESTEFDIELRGNLVVVKGDSGSGKTYFFNSLKTAKQIGLDVSVHGMDLKQVHFLDSYSNDLVDLISLFQSTSDKLFIIDDADNVLTDEVASYMGWDLSNQYLVFARGGWSFNISPNYYARMVKKGHTRVLRYSFEAEGWK